MYKYHKTYHKSSHICECENRSLLLKGRRRRQKNFLTELDWANPRQSSETAARWRIHPLIFALLVSSAILPHSYSSGPSSTTFHNSQLPIPVSPRLSIWYPIMFKMNSSGFFPPECSSSS